MIEMNAVVAAHHLVGFPDWPTGPYSDGDVVLSGRMSREEIGTALAAIAQYNNGQEVGPDGPALLGGLLEQEAIIMSGGLLVRDTRTGVVVEPGCCQGFEDWRDWRGVLDGRHPWLGHSPDPKVEIGDGLVRVWPDDRRTDGPACEIPLAELPGHLAAVRQDLLGFLELVRKWAPYGMGEALAERFDEHFHISAPL
ncbi:hypothetical protein [Lentzea nigeriaca]|uniref:hypothetical protein n=1 Tax=Lentzea nigeriaca TaxID=1128665 RepID=UPI001957A298|nr:hypothetical protein [Lentzea nigeriaca]MBM7857419.1 hypothetical protein [Lentzea nigeriaca]